MKRHSTDANAGALALGAVRSRPPAIDIRQKRDAIAHPRANARPRAIETRLLLYLKSLNR